MNRKDRSKNKIDFTKKTGSISFFLAVPTNLTLGCIALIALLLLIQRQSIRIESWIPFLFGVAGTFCIFAFFGLKRVRVFLHEVKHGAVVVLTGNVMQDLVVKEETGHVSYSVYKSKKHYEPFIMLAPYFFPLLSLPTLLVAFVTQFFAGTNYAMPLDFILGVMLATDLKTAWFELYPNQSDLQRIKGGFPMVALFVGGANFLWIMICALWIQARFEGYTATLSLTLEAVAKFLFGN